jgi:hypothetical protein
MRVEIRPTVDGRRWLWFAWARGRRLHRGIANTPEQAQLLGELAIEVSEARERQVYELEFEALRAKRSQPKPKAKHATTIPPWLRPAGQEAGSE